MNLAQAVASNDLAMVKDLLGKDDQDPNMTFPCSPRQSAYAVQPIMAGHAENFEPDDILYEATPLNLAVLNGNESIVRALIDAGADLNKKDGRGRTPLLCAVYGLDTLTITPANLALIAQTSPAHLSILKNCILPHQSITLTTLNAPQDEIKGITPLCLASYLGKEIVVRCLLEAGKVDVNATDRKGATALMYAARDRHTAVVKTLLRHGASPDQTDNNGWSSIQYGQMYPEIVLMFEETLRCKRPEVLDLLSPPESPQPRMAISTLDRTPDGASNTVLPYSLSQSLIRYPLYYSKLSSLLSSLPAAQTQNPRDAGLQSSGASATGTGGTNADRRTSSDVLQAQRTTHSALLEAIKLGDFMTVQSLLMAPPSLNDGNGVNGSGNAGAANVPTVAPVNHHDLQTGLTPLHHALRTRPLPSMETIKILYQAGADMNAQTHYGRTALHHLCRFSLEHALTLPTHIDENGVTSTTSPTTATSQAANEDAKSGRRKHRHRTETSGSTGSNHLAPTNKEAPSSSSASTASSNDISTGPANGRYAHASTSDSGAVKSASPEEIRRASQHLADSCRLLIRLGSLVHIPDRHGNTPLHFAVEYGCVVEVVKVLVEEGASIDQRNNKGLKAIDVVRGEHSEEMKRILTEGVRKKSSGNSNDGATSSSATVSGTQQPRNSILKPLNLPETLHEVDFQFNQVLQNLEHYQNHTSVSIETSLQYITDQILLGWSPDNQGANGYVLSQEEYNADLVSSLENLKYELESTYELLMITEEQYRDVITFYESELDEMTKQNLTVLTAYDSEKSKVTALYSVYQRLIEQLEELEAENEGLKTELEEKKRRGLVSLGRLVHGAMGGQWSGARNGTSIMLARRQVTAKLRAAAASTGTDEDKRTAKTISIISSKSDASSMILAPRGTPNSGKRESKLGNKDEKELGNQGPMSTEHEPNLHTIAVLSQKISLLEQELSSKGCDIKERDLLVSELTDLIEDQTKASEAEIKHRQERIEGLNKVINAAKSGEQVQAIVEELVVKWAEHGTQGSDADKITSGGTSGDWTSLLMEFSGPKVMNRDGEQDLIATLQQELELIRSQMERLELATTNLKERWQQAMQELETIQKTEGNRQDSCHGDAVELNGDESSDVGMSASSSMTTIGARVTKVMVPKRPANPQEQPLVLLLDESGAPEEESPKLEEIELVFEILMANLAEISRDAEEADHRLRECNRVKEQIYQKCLYLDSLQQSLDDNVEKIVSQPFKADRTPPSFMDEQLKLQAQLNVLMEQAETVTNMYSRLKVELHGYKEEKQVRLRDLDQVRDLMRKIGPQELLRGLLVKLDNNNPDDPAAERRREAIAAAVAQGMELAAEMASEEDSRGDRVASHLWRNSCSVVDEGDMQDAINSRLSTASIDYYTQSCSISDHKLFIQSLCSTLYALQMTTTHQVVSLKASLSESKASLVLADQELSNVNDHIAGLYDEVGTLRSQLRDLQQELDRLIQHRKAEVEKVWEIVGEVRIASNSSTGAGMSPTVQEEDDTRSVSSADTQRKNSIQSRALANTSRYSTALDATMVIGQGNNIEETKANGTGSGDRNSIARSLSLSRAERASVLRNISTPLATPLAENEEGSVNGTAVATETETTRASQEYSESGSGSGSEVDRHALISAEMDKLRSVHLELLSTITDYKKQISAVKDRNLKLVATLLDRERVRLWTADGQDEVISAIVGQHGHAGHGGHNTTVTTTGSMALSASASLGTLSLDASSSHNTLVALSGSQGSLAGNGGSMQGNGNGLSSSGSSNSLSMGYANKKHHHLSLTAAEDGIKLLRCQLERIRQCEITRFTEMGVGLTMNNPGLYPSSQGGSPTMGGDRDSRSGGLSTLAEEVIHGGKVMGPRIGLRKAAEPAQPFTKFEATLYSDLESRYGAGF